MTQRTSSTVNKYETDVGMKVWRTVVTFEIVAVIHDLKTVVGSSKQLT